jgi:Zn-dependent peptidase ImmA (M78 family)
MKQKGRMMWGNEYKIKDIAAKAEAYQIVELYSFTKPEEIILENIAMARGVLVVEGPLHGAEARLVRKGGRGIIRVSEDLREMGRKRFSIAHELGHWELHKDIFSDVYSEVAMKGYGVNKIEIEANIFAAELLMPSKLFRPRCEDVQPNLQSIKRLADEFNTSFTSAIVRFVDETDHSCAVVFSAEGRVTWWRPSRKCEEIWFESKQEIRKGSLAWECLNGNSVPSRWQRVPAEIWLHDPGKYEINKVFEQSILLGGYGVVLSLLWID